MSKITIDGNTAAATIAYQFSDAATIYPITPSSTMAELCDQWASEGRKNIFGNTVKVVEMQSEAGASGALHGSLAAGALTTTFTASQGLLLMIPNMYKIAGELTPCVMHVSARALATHALSIFGDHSDVMSVRQCGWAMLASGSVQEAMDMALVSHIATLKSNVPFVHFFDGFRTSHEINTIEDIDVEKIKSIVPWDNINEFRLRSLNSNNPHQQGTAQNPDIYFQNRESANAFYQKTPAIVQDTMNEVAKITGRKYNLFDYYGAKDAKYVIVSMGSSTTTIELTIDYLNKVYGNNYGLIKVRLYRPFATSALLSALPDSVEKIAVLDRTKEPGADGEPLYKDVVTALFDSKFKNVEVVGGRYGLGSKEFTPSMVKAVFDNLENEKSKNGFTVGINDDLTNTSLEIKDIIHPDGGDVTECKFYGFGGDGTVSANKSSIKIIGNNTEYNGQAYFEYDSKKSGNATISHIRFGKGNINQSYMLDNIDFVAVHNQSYVTKYNILKNVKDNATLLLNTEWDMEHINKFFSNALKKDIATRGIKLYTIDAVDIAKRLGLGNKINLIMQSAFFKLIGIMPYDKAIDEMKAFAKKAYAKAGEEAYNNNCKAIDSAKDELNEIKIPEEWKNITTSDEENTDQAYSTDKYYTDIMQPVQRLDGDSIPVSKFDPRGIVPTNTARYEKRGVADSIPCWISGNCVQCNTCAFVCPHAAIRPYLIDEKDLVDMPENMIVLDAIAEPGKKYVLQVSSKDCTGCGVCVNACPAKNKALEMVDASKTMEIEAERYEYINSIPHQKSKLFKETTVKGSQFNKPYFEFSGACAGCGETPYIKVISQMFGDRMVVANATGCSSIYGGSAPACPYAKDDQGHGVAWANSLFEDNAEFGLGIKTGLDIKYNILQNKLQELQNNSDNAEIKALIDKYFAETTTAIKRSIGKEIVTMLETNSDQLSKDIITLRDHFAKDSMWIIGGDGWAYDIGYGGLDHVLASGENVNILVLDTEVYSNTGGQASKSTPVGAVAKFAANGKRTNKKDLGLMATTYKNVYVAKVAMGANMAQFLTAINEAEKYDGVSLIIAYAPCINHGLKMSNSQLEMKKAVDTGYWHLWRYNPTLADDGKNPFILDSKEPTMDYNDFLMGENRYKALLAKDKDLAEKLFAEAKENAKSTYEYYKSLAEK